nr:MAG: MC035R [Molluscum contagiosum virus]
MSIEAISSADGLSGLGFTISIIYALEIAPPPREK